MAVPCDENDLAAAAFGAGFPAEDRFEGAGGVVLAELAEELAAGAEVEGDVGWGAEVEVAVRHAEEVGVEFCGVAVAEGGGDGGAEFVHGDMESGGEGVFAFEESGGGGVELADETFLPVGPAGFVSGAAVCEGVEEEGVQPFAAADDGGEGGDDFGVVEVSGGGGVPEEEVVIDEEEEELAAVDGDLETAADLIG